MLSSHTPHHQQPLVELRLLLHKYDRSIKIITLIDTGVVLSIFKSDILPDS